jgi:hypothetical protein
MFLALFLMSPEKRFIAVRRTINRGFNHLKKTDPEIEKQIQKLYDEGFCDEEIADKTGKSKSTIGQWRKKKGLPLVFVNRKRLTKKESELVQEYLYRHKKFRRIKKEKTIVEREKGLTAFVMSLNHQLSQISQIDIENYIIAHNEIDLTRRNELLRTNLVKQFSVPQIPVAILYNFASTIIAKRIFFRDGHCQNCGSPNPLRLYCSAGNFNLLDENLRTLCENCYSIAKR